MRYALLADNHANFPALEAVVEDLRGRAGIDAIYHLGDLVGYARAGGAAQGAPR